MKFTGSIALTVSKTHKCHKNDKARKFRKTGNPQMVTQHFQAPFAIKLLVPPPLLINTGPNRPSFLRQPLQLDFYTFHQFPENSFEKTTSILEDSSIVQHVESQRSFHQMLTMPRVHSVTGRSKEKEIPAARVATSFHGAVGRC